MDVENRASSVFTGNNSKPQAENDATPTDESGAEDRREEARVAHPAGVDRGRPEGERATKALATGRSRPRLTYSLAGLILPRVLAALAPTPLFSYKSRPTRFWIREGRVSRTEFRDARERGRVMFLATMVILLPLPPWDANLHRLLTWNVQWDSTTTTAQT